MLEYNIIYCAILLGIFSEIFNRKKDYTVYYALVCTFMLVVCGLRKDTIGIDTENYLYYFTNPSDRRGYYQGMNDLEPGLAWLNGFLHLFITNKYIYQLLFTALCQIPLYIFFKRYSANKFISLFLYAAFSIGTSVYFLNYNAMRQSLAIGLFIWTMLAYLNSGGNIKKAKVFLPFIAMVLVHMSSLIVILPILLTRLKITKRKYVSIILISTLVGFVMNYFFSYLEMGFILLTGGSFYIQNLGNGSFSIISLLPYSLICLGIVIFSKEEELNNVFFNSLIFAIIVQGVMAFSGNNIDRMCAYFYVPGYIAIGNFLMSQNKALSVRILMIVCVLVYFTYKYFMSLWLMTENGHDFIPYKWCF